MGDVSVRPATADDAAAICTIYNQGIEDRVATLETELRTPEERRQWMASRGPRHPVVVRDPPAARSWGGAASTRSTCVPPTTTWWTSRSTWSGPGGGAGWGKALLQHVLGLARQLGYHKMVLATFPYNDAGLALYRRTGFTPVGVYHWQQGQLDGRWVDVLIMEQLL